MEIQEKQHLEKISSGHGQLKTNKKEKKTREGNVEIIEFFSFKLIMN